MKNINELLFDKEFRQQLRENKSAIDTLYQYGEEDIEYKVVTNSKNITYIVIPSKDLYTSLDNINAASAAHTAGSAGTVGSIGTVSSAASATTCASSLGSASSAGSISSASTVNPSQ